MKSKSLCDIPQIHQLFTATLFCTMEFSWKALTAYCAENTHINVCLCACVFHKCVLSLGVRCYHEYVHEKWYQTLSLVSYQQSFMFIRARIMLIQLKWHVDPWIKQLIAIYFLLFKNMRFNFKLVLCVLRVCECANRVQKVFRVYMWKTKYIYLHFLMEVLMRATFQTQKPTPNASVRRFYLMKCVFILWNSFKSFKSFNMELGKRKVVIQLIVVATAHALRFWWWVWKSHLTRFSQK